MSAQLLLFTSNLLHNPSAMDFPCFRIALAITAFPGIYQSVGAKELRTVFGKAAQDLEPNPPLWPDSVFVFEDRNLSEVERRIEAVTKLTFGLDDFGQFIDDRFVFLFKPGNYSLDVPVGYYTQVLGLGRHPEDVTFLNTSRGVHCDQSDEEISGRYPGVYNTFWRGAENFANRPSSRETVWAVSQAAPLRRVLIDGDLAFGTRYVHTMSDGFAAGGGSGGFVSDIRVTGDLDFVLQQQWLVRNSNLGSTSHYTKPARSANFVFVGVQGSPQQTNCTDAGRSPDFPSPQLLVVKEAPVTIEKPYITIRESGKYDLIVPEPVRSSFGTQWEGPASVVGFEHVFVATPQSGAALINEKLASGLNVILTPGIYHLLEPLRILKSTADGDRQSQVLLGMGLATLIPTRGTAAIEVEDGCAVRIAGILLQAGPVHSDVLLRLGSKGTDYGCSSPGLLSDVYLRVGGPDVESVSVDTMLEINMDDVILDNLWLWRADHCKGQILNDECPSRNCKTALRVNGNGVIAYGLAAEHTQEDVVVWNGEAGQSFFFQAELDSFAKLPSDETPEYGPTVAGYRVNAHTHSAWGTGVYAFFVSAGVVVPAGIVLRHARTLDGFVCPFKWDLNPEWWQTKASTIEEAIAVADALGAIHNSSSKDFHKSTPLVITL